MYYISMHEASTSFGCALFLGPLRISNLPGESQIPLEFQVKQVVKLTSSAALLFRRFEIEYDAVSG
jgi:hypothetical protein